MSGPGVRRALLPLLAALALGACGREERFREAALMTGGDPEAGRSLIRGAGCGSCHTIPGVRGANSLVGPPLTGIAHRVYIAGVLENTPENMVRWVRDPQAVDSLTAMPDLGLSDDEARHVAAYLYTLR